MLDDDGSYIKQKRTGKTIQLKKEIGVYVMDAAIMGQRSRMSSEDGKQLASAEQQPDGNKRGF